MKALPSAQRSSWARRPATVLVAALGICLAAPPHSTALSSGAQQVAAPPGPAPAASRAKSRPAKDSPLIDLLLDDPAPLSQDATEPPQTEVEREPSGPGDEAPRENEPQQADAPLLSPASPSGQETRRGGPLGDLGRRMRSVAELIAGPADGYEEVRLGQQQIVRDLDLLIGALERANGRRRQGQAGNKRQQNAGSQPGSAQAGSKPGQQPGNRPGGKQPGGAAATAGESAEAGQPLSGDQRRRLVDQVWGHLPPRAREQMQQAAGEEFHPKYQLEIEAYYRRLAEPGGPAR